MSDHLPPKWVITMGRNTHLRISLIVIACFGNVISHFGRS